MLTLSSCRKLAFPIIVLLCIITESWAHEHHEETGPYEDNFRNDEPIDVVLKWHMGLQAAVWGLVFPIGMVLGIARNRWHVPLQVVGVVVTLAGYYLGHHHSGRAFHTTAHGHFAKYLYWYLITQASFGTFLKLHIWQESRFRRIVVLMHGIVGKSFPIVGWVQMIFGGIAAMGFCFGEHTIQCLAHMMMGSAFIAYAVIMLIMLRVGAGWLARKRMSQELLDSWVIMIWGIVNTFTEHDFMQKSSEWSIRDMQHVSLGVLWWAGGALGLFLSRNGRRSVVPAIIIGMTGYAMSSHEQKMEYQMSIHKVFGYALVAGALARIVEICFILRDTPTPPGDATPGPNSFQHLPPYLLTLAGLTFMSATEEQIAWISDSGMDHVTYTIIMFSGSFALYLTASAVLEIYERTSKKEPAPKSGRVPDLEAGRRGWLPSMSAVRSVFPGAGRRLRGLQTDRFAAEEYEVLPLTATSEPYTPDASRRWAENGHATGGVKMGGDGEVVFDVGDADLEHEASMDSDHDWRRG